MNRLLDNSVVNKIAESCIDLYKKLPKTGKPNAEEWTVLSCVILFNKLNRNFEVISLGTGSKCIGHTKMSPAGDVLNDSHAEVIARRGFILYLLSQIEKCIGHQPSIFVEENKQMKLKDDVEFIFYSSQLPCGDASIVLKQETGDEYGDIVFNKKHKLLDDTLNANIKKTRLGKDIYRTGAKCLPHCTQDIKEPGVRYHLLGQVRTKPGRGDRTLSVSCSDKIARWVHVGIQGSLLDLLLSGPIYISNFIFGGGVPFSLESLNRAFFARTVEFKPSTVPGIYQASTVFPCIKTNDKMRPAPGSIIYSKTDQPSQVAVQGIRLGLTKKTSSSPVNSLCISKYNIYRKFQEILTLSDLKENIVGDKTICDITYSEMKSLSKRYFINWTNVKNEFFKTWTAKPDIWNFKIR